MMKTIAAALIFLALTACISEISPPMNDKPAAPEVTVQPQETSPMRLQPPILDETVSAAVRDLAARLRISVDEITVLDATTVIWPDSSLGCPEASAMYMQILQEGKRLRLQVGEQIYHYHSSATRRPFLCQNPTEPVSTSPNASPTKNSLGRPLDTQAIEDLVTRLKLDKAEIEIVRMEEVDWPDGSLGCPQPGMRYKQVVVNGTFIQLRAGGHLYNYHSGTTQLPFLCTSKDEVVPEDLGRK